MLFTPLLPVVGAWRGQSPENVPSVPLPSGYSRGDAAACPCAAGVPLYLGCPANYLSTTQEVACPPLARPPHRASRFPALRPPRRPSYLLDDFSGHIKTGNVTALKATCIPMHLSPGKRPENATQLPSLLLPFDGKGLLNAASVRSREHPAQEARTAVGREAMFPLMPPPH